MKLIVVAFALLAVAVAAPPVANEVAQVLRSSFEQNPEGGYNFGFETENGIKRQETGELKSVVDEENKPHAVVVVRGQVSYVDNDGNVQAFEFVADENGYRAEGPGIPKIPARR